MSLTVIILTKDEERHIARCLTSIMPFADHCLVVDSGSRDCTVDLARELGAEVKYNAWVNYATQLNWGLQQIPRDTEWVMRLDADEIVQPDLAHEIAARLSDLGPEIDGIYVSRRMTFQGRKMRWGGLFPVRVLRIFRNGRGRCENRWMDEHILVDGPVAQFKGGILDDNLNTLSWWTEKHNAYASREVVDLLNLEYRFMAHETVASLSSGSQAGLKRWIKERFYSRLPGGSRALLYFLYRYLFRLGFLDGREGAAFHILQGFWYRYLVDVKRREVLKYMDIHAVDVVTAIRNQLGIHVNGDE